MISLPGPVRARVTPRCFLLGRLAGPLLAHSNQTVITQAN